MEKIKGKKGEIKDWRTGEIEGIETILDLMQEGDEEGTSPVFVMMNDKGVVRTVYVDYVRVMLENDDANE